MLTFEKNVYIIAIVMIVTISGNFVNCMYEGSTCVLKTGNFATCTKLQNCKSIDRGLKTKKIDFNSIVTCSFIGKIPIVCCPDHQPVPTAPPTRPFVKPSDFNYEDHTLQFKQYKNDISNSVDLPSVSTRREPKIILNIKNITITDQDEFIDLNEILEKRRNLVGTSTESTSPKVDRISIKRGSFFNDEFIIENEESDVSEKNLVRFERLADENPRNIIKISDPQNFLKQSKAEPFIKFDKNNRPTNLIVINKPNQYSENNVAENEDYQWINNSVARAQQKNSASHIKFPETENIEERSGLSRTNSEQHTKNVNSTLLFPLPRETVDDRPIWDKKKIPSLHPTNHPTHFIQTTTQKSFKTLTTTRRVFKFPGDIGRTENNVNQMQVTSQPLTNNRINTRKAVQACERYTQNLGLGIDFHIIGGERTQPGEFPHMAGIGYRTFDTEDYKWDCGGSLISEKYILTAAHCCNKKDNQPKLIRLGKTTLRNNDDGAEAQDYEVKSIVMHPSYRSFSKYDDIALIELAKPVEFKDKIGPACLYTNQADLSESDVLVATGWGVDDNERRTQSNYLLKVNLTISALNQCNQSHVNYGVERSYSKGILKNQLCAYDPANSKDSCQGDSGGPLQLVNSTINLSTIVGVVSFGIGCASAIPSVYTRVASYLEWIEPIVWP